MPSGLGNLSPTIGFSILLPPPCFVGAGVPIPTPVGLMIAIGAPNMMTGQWWTALFPGLARPDHWATPLSTVSALPGPVNRR
jgi:peptide/nickel transport system permease protein